jgi:hypothetical protein
VALGGAGLACEPGALPAENLLTAEDVAGLDLAETQLVVLSAAQTNTDRGRCGETVLGLRRAFVAAGARTLVMSLWRGPFLPTAILLERFYHNLHHQGRLPRAEALREAQAHVRDLTIGRLRPTWLAAEEIARLAALDPASESWLRQLAAQPDDHQPFTDPHFWGAFLCQGDPGPLPESSSRRRFELRGVELPAERELSRGVHREVDPLNPQKRVWWLGGRGRWRRISPDQPVQVWGADGAQAAAVVVAEFRETSRNPLLRAVGRLLGRERDAYALPTGRTALPVGQVRRDAVLVWLENGSAPLTPAEVADFWEGSEKCEPLGPGLFLVLGVKLGESGGVGRSDRC